MLRSRKKRCAPWHRYEISNGEFYKPYLGFSVRSILNFDLRLTRDYELLEARCKYIHGRNKRS